MVRSNLSVLMAERNIKMAELTKATGISKTALTDLVYNRSKAIQFNTINRLCIYFGITPDELISYIPYDIEISKLDLSTEKVVQNNFSTTRPILTVELTVQQRKQSNNVSLVFYIVDYIGPDDTPIDFDLILSNQDNNLLTSLPVPFRTDLENRIAAEFINKRNLDPNSRIIFKW